MALKSKSYTEFDCQLLFLEQECVHTPTPLTITQFQFDIAVKIHFENLAEFLNKIIEIVRLYEIKAIFHVWSNTGK